MLLSSLLSCSFLRDRRDRNHHHHHHQPHTILATAALIFLTLPNTLGFSFIPPDILPPVSSPLLPRTPSGQRRPPPPFAAPGYYTCNEITPCPNSACCATALGTCGYGPAYCGTGTPPPTPNDICCSNCDAMAECGPYAAVPGTACPLNACCTLDGTCGISAQECAAGSGGGGERCVSNCDADAGQPATATATEGDVQARIVGYYQATSAERRCMGMSVGEIPVENLSHLFYATAAIEATNFAIGPQPGTDVQLLAEVASLKSRNPALVVGVSIGGGPVEESEPIFHTITSSPTTRNTFVASLVAFMTHFGFEAVDINWAYPGGGGDAANYVALIKEIKAAFAARHRRWQVSFTAPAVYRHLRNFDVAGMVDAADFVNFLMYDVQGVWDGELDDVGTIQDDGVRPHANLTEMDRALRLLWRNGVDPAKVNAGLGFYSRTFTLEDPTCREPGCPFKGRRGEGGGMAGTCTLTSGTLSYGELSDILSGHPDVTPTYDVDAAVHYVVWDEDQWGSFEDNDSLERKIDLFNAHGLGGVAIWSLDQDTPELDALRGVLYPRPLQPRASAGDRDHVAYWTSKTAGSDCETTECGGRCAAGTMYVTDVPCPKSGNMTRRLCCPLVSAPDPGTCVWRGEPWFCTGECREDEIALITTKDGGNGHCHNGAQSYCCPRPSTPGSSSSSSIDTLGCRWKDTCSDNQTLMTFSGTFRQDAVTIPLANISGLTGQQLADALGPYAVDNFRSYCCDKEEADQLSDCHWAGSVGEGVASCKDNHCKPGAEVALTRSRTGGGQTCAPQFERQRVFCCTPTGGKDAATLPVPLENLFPNPPPVGGKAPEFAFEDIEVDEDWNDYESGEGGGGGDSSGTSPDRDRTAFGFVVITAPAQVHATLDKRDGAPWELFDCEGTSTTEAAQTIRILCTEDDAPSQPSRCSHIHSGRGVPGTILEMPPGCGPGRYAVAVALTPSQNQTLPDHLGPEHHKRAADGRAQVFDLTFDHDFSRVPRDYGDSMMRIDYSNMDGYWDAVVSRPGQHKTRRSLDGFHHVPSTTLRRRWLADEWRDAFHAGGLAPHELHRRWFGSSALDWLRQLTETGEAQSSRNVTNSVTELLNVLFLDERIVCPVGKATARARVTARAQAKVLVETTFGITIITRLTSPLDLSQSYLFYKNKGSVKARFKAEAKATLSYSSGDVELGGLNKMSVSPFRVPGIVTLGPNMAVYASFDAAATMGGSFRADVVMSEWETLQTYPQTAEYPTKATKQADHQGTQTVRADIDASVLARGEVGMHIKPVAMFGIDFDTWWGVKSTKIDLVLDNFVLFHAQLSRQLGNGNAGDSNQCPFKYGIDGGSMLYGELRAPRIWRWRGYYREDIAVIKKSLTNTACAPPRPHVRRNMLKWEKEDDDQDKPEWWVDSSDPRKPSDTGKDLDRRLVIQKVDRYTIGPLIKIPKGWVECPLSADVEKATCALCSSVGGSSSKGSGSGSGGGGGGDNSSGAKGLPATMSCPWLPPPTDEVCSDSVVHKRDRATKQMTLSWAGTFPLSQYYSCSTSSLSDMASVKKWYMPENAHRASCSPAIAQYNQDPGANTIQGVPITKFANDHVFDPHLFSDFLEWLCNGSPRVYLFGGEIPFPDKWGRPDSQWCAGVLGPAGGFAFPAPTDEDTHQNMVANSASALGSVGEPELMALYHEANNGLKTLWTKGTAPPIGNLDAAAAINLVKNSANVFQYLQHGPQAAWTRPPNTIETMCAQFDKTWWFFGTSPIGSRPLFRPPAPAGVTTWGLRTLWCYWIDRHLDAVERTVELWLAQAHSRVRDASSEGDVGARDFVMTHMSAGGLASKEMMRFPRDGDFAALPLPGTPGSRDMVKSRYMMWGRGGHGALGL